MRFERFLRNRYGGGNGNPAIRFACSFIACRRSRFAPRPGIWWCFVRPNRSMMHCGRRGAGIGFFTIGNSSCGLSSMEACRNRKLRLRANYSRGSGSSMSKGTSQVCLNRHQRSRVLFASIRSARNLPLSLRIHRKIRFFMQITMFWHSTLPSELLARIDAEVSLLHGGGTRGQSGPRPP